MKKTTRAGLKTYLSQTSNRSDVRPGLPLPLGALDVDGGVNQEFKD
jgi:hypothetical protein